MKKKKHSIPETPKEGEMRDCNSGYSNILKILPPQNENAHKKTSNIFHISAQTIDCGYSLEPPRRGGSNEYPQFMFWAEIRKIMYTPVNPSFTIWKWGLRRSNLYRYVFVMGTALNYKIHIRSVAPIWPKYIVERAKNPSFYQQQMW